MPLIDYHEYSIMSWLTQTLFRLNKSTIKDQDLLEQYKQLQKVNKEILPQCFKHGYKVHKSIVDKSEKFQFEVVNIAPEQIQDNNKLVLYLHGGAFIMKIDDLHWRFVQKLVDGLQCRILVPLYPVTPKGTYQDTCPQLFNYYQSLLSEGKEIYIIGGSAGGWLAMNLIQQVRDNGLPLPKHTILMSPWLDLSVSNPSIKKMDKQDPTLHYEVLKECGRMWTGGEDPRGFNVVNRNLRGLGKITIFNGGVDMLSPEILEFYQRLKLIGSEPLMFNFRNLMHNYPLFFLPESQATVSQMIGIIKGELLGSILLRGTVPTSIEKLLLLLVQENYF